MTSVIIPAYNAAPFIGAAIESVLAQGSDSLEVLVVNDGSTDETAAIATAFGPPVHCWTLPQGGAAAARNAGVARASGDLIAFVDADDLWTPGKLARQREVLDNDPTLEAVFGHVQQFWIDAATGTRQVGPAMPGQTAGTMLIRAEALRRVGPYSTSRTLVEQLEWFGRALNAGLVHVTLPDVVMLRRIHDQNVGVRNREDQHRQYLQVLRETIQQKRRRAET